MKHLQLQGKYRTLFGNQARKLRNLGMVAAVVYGKNYPSTAIEVSFSEFSNVYKITGKNHVIDLSIESKIQPVVVHSLDLHPVTKKLRHVDFLAVNLKEKTIISVPVVYINEAPAVKEFVAILNTYADELSIEALPDKIPNEIVVDLSSLVSMDSIISIKDLSHSKDFTFIEEDSFLIASISKNIKSEQDETDIVSEETGVKES